MTRFPSSIYSFDSGCFAAALWKALALAYLVWLAWLATSLYNNHRAAKKLHLPVTVRFVSSKTLLWLLGVLLPLLPRRHPADRIFKDWGRYSYIGWEYDDKFRSHAEKGKVFIICKPGGNKIVIADAKVAHHVLTRRREFIKPAQNYRLLEYFGSNILTANGDAWQRQKRLASFNLGPKVYADVWKETLTCTDQMLDGLTEQLPSTTETLSIMLANIATRVLSKVALATPYMLGIKHHSAGSTHSMAYEEALRLVLRNFSLINLVPSKILRFPFMPKKIQKAGIAVNEWILYMQEMLSHSVMSITVTGECASCQLDASLFRAHKARRNSALETLDEHEALGNLFIYHFAGSESISNSLATAIGYLCTYPKYQAWLSEEIAATVGTTSKPNSWNFRREFSRLKRCQAAMLETLRLHGIIASLPRTTGDQPRAIMINGREFAIPANTTVSINLQALHCDPNVWGRDALEWRPERWISHSRGGMEVLSEPVEGSYFPWSAGARACPGKKFSQIEFVAVIATLFSRHRVEPVLKENETLEQALARTLDMVKDSGMVALTLQMRDPSSVKFKWIAI